MVSMSPVNQLKRNSGRDQISPGEVIIFFLLRQQRHLGIGGCANVRDRRESAQDGRANACASSPNGGILVEQEHLFPDLVIVKAGDARESFPEPGLARKVLAYNDKLFLAEHRMRKNWVGALHSHTNEQLVYVVSGRLTVTCSGKTFELRTGDSFVVRGGVQHCAAAIEDSVVVDIFTPCREDYLPTPSM